LSRTKIWAAQKNRSFFPSDVSMVASDFFSLALPEHSEKHPSEAQDVSFLGG